MFLRDGSDRLRRGGPASASLFCMLNVGIVDGPASTHFVDNFADIPLPISYICAAAADSTSDALLADRDLTQGGCVVSDRADQAVQNCRRCTLCQFGISRPFFQHFAYSAPFFSPSANPPRFRKTTARTVPA
ncbi:unnamed protein product [Symbiodinium natans]|uniref:Uncharacterized protein n=1 Tax=Symbiodinium natans TaxID=878477 RepID=A0A812LEG8_9DINO|nr:unnamed protein product [Symbiodinium natans]